MHIGGYARVCKDARHFSVVVREAERPYEYACLPGTWNARTCRDPRFGLSQIAGGRVSRITRRRTASTSQH